MRSLRVRTKQERTHAAKEAAACLGAGGWIVYPTETVYGFGCALVQPVLHDLAVAKRRGREGPLLLLVPTIWDSRALHWTDSARRLAAEFWPGPLTLALEADAGVFPEEVTAHDGTVAIRCSSHPVASAVVQALGGPLTSTSANVANEPPALDADAAAAAAVELGLAMPPLILDGGVLEPSLPSTLVRVIGDVASVLRAGAIGTGDIRRVLGEANVQ